MKLEFKYNKYWQIISMIYEGIGPPDSVLKRILPFAPLISKEFVIAGRIYSILTNTEGEQFDDVLLAFGEDSEKKIRTNLKKLHKEKIMETINQIKINWEGIKPKLQWKTAMINKEYKKYEKQHRTVIKEIFGFDLPKKITIMLSYSYGPRFLQGSASIKKKPAINLCVGEKKRIKDIIQVLIHELIHWLIGKEGFKNKLNKQFKGETRLFEEALITYFVPDAFLAYKMGLGGSQNPKEIFEKACKYRAWHCNWVEKLLPFMGEYFKIYKKKSIWKFLEEKNIVKF